MMFLSDGIEVRAENSSQKSGERSGNRPDSGVTPGCSLAGSRLEDMTVPVKARPHLPDAQPPQAALLNDDKNGSSERLLAINRQWRLIP